MTRASDSQAGLAMAGVVVALVISAAVLAVTVALGASVIQSFGDARRASAMQSQLVRGMAHLTRAIRHASPAVGRGEIQDAAYCTEGRSGVIHLQDEAGASDTITVIHATGETLGVVAALRPGRLEVTAPWRGFPALGAGDHIVVAAPTGDAGVFLRVAAVTSEADRQVIEIDEPCQDVDELAPGSLIVGAVLARYAVGPSGLTRDTAPFGSPEVLAPGVDDMQLEWARGTTRAVRITLTARSGQRRRVLATVAVARNLAGAP